MDKILKECVQYYDEMKLLDGYNSGSEGKSPANDKVVKSDSGIYHILTTILSISTEPFSNYIYLVSKYLSAGPSTNLSSTFIHLVHPYALNHVMLFLEHIKLFRYFLRLTTSQEDRYRVARELLLDIIDSSAIDLEALEKVLLEVKDEVKSNAGMDPIF